MQLYQLSSYITFFTSPQYSEMNSFFCTGSLMNIPQPATSEGANSKCCGSRVERIKKSLDNIYTKDFKLERSADRSIIPISSPFDSLVGGKMLQSRFFFVLFCFFLK